MHISLFQYSVLNKFVPTTYTEIHRVHMLLKFAEHTHTRARVHIHTLGFGNIENILLQLLQQRHYDHCCNVVLKYFTLKLQITNKMEHFNYKVGMI